MKPTLRQLLQLHQLSPSQRLVLANLSQQFPDCDPEFLRFLLSHYDLEPSEHLGDLPPGAREAIHQHQLRTLEGHLVDKLLALRGQVPEDVRDLGGGGPGDLTALTTTGKGRTVFGGGSASTQPKEDFESQRMNQLLGVMVQVFPDCDLRVLRGSIEHAQFKTVYSVAEHLLAPGAYKPLAPRSGPPVLAREDMFRSKNYVWCCRKHLSHNEFPLLWKSTIDAVCLSLLPSSPPPPPPWAPSYSVVPPFLLFVFFLSPRYLPRPTMTMSGPFRFSRV